MPPMEYVTDTDLTIALALMLQSVGLAFLLGGSFQGNVSDILVPVEDFVQQNHPGGVFIKTGDFASVLHEQCDIVLEHRRVQDEAEPPFVGSMFRGDASDILVEDRAQEDRDEAAFVAAGRDEDETDDDVDNDDEDVDSSDDEYATACADADEGEDANTATTGVMGGNRTKANIQEEDNKQDAATGTDGGKGTGSITSQGDLIQAFVDNYLLERRNRRAAMRARMGYGSDSEYESDSNCGCEGAFGLDSDNEIRHLGLECPRRY